MRRWKKKPPPFRQDNEAYFEHQLQLDLCMTDDELSRMPYRRFVRWIAFYKVRAEMEEKARADAEKKSKAKRRR